LKWLRAATEEIIAGIRSSIESLSSKKVEHLIQLLLEAKDQKIFIIGIGRSGLIPASILVKILGTSEFYTIITSLYSEGKPPHRLGKEPNVLFENVGSLSGKKVLIVDDFARTGDTINSVIKRIIESNAKEVKSAVVGLRQDSSYKPDFIGTIFEGCLVFPWDSPI